MRHLAPLWLCVCASLARGGAGAGPRAGADMRVVLVTGGETTPTQAEIFDPATGTSCSLPDLPDPRSGAVHIPRDCVTVVSSDLSRRSVIA